MRQTIKPNKSSHDIIKVICEKMQERGMGTDTLALLSGIDRRSLQRYIKNQRPITLVNAEACLNVFGMSIVSESWRKRNG